MAKARTDLLPEQPPAPAGDAPPGAPVADAGGPVPRVVSQGERAPKGLTRYKIRAENHHPRQTRYILAHNELDARKEYAKAEGFEAAQLAARKRGHELEPLELVVTTLPD